MKQISFLFIFILVSCSSLRKNHFIEKQDNLRIPFHSYSSKTHSDFNNYINNINKELLNNKIKAIDLTISYDTYNVLKDFNKKYNSNIGAYCFINRYTKNEIIIVKDIFNKLNENEKYWLLYHEVGHCSFNLKHLHYYPERIMNSNFNKEETIYLKKALKEYMNYIKDLE